MQDSRFRMQEEGSFFRIKFSLFMKKKIIAGLFLLFSIAVISSCVPSKPVKEETVIPSNRLIKKLEANRRRIKTFEGTGSLKIETAQLDITGTFSVEIKKPDSMKISFYGPFGIDMAKLLLTQSDFIFYDVMKNQIYKGKNDDKILKEVFKVDMTFDNLIDAFSGAVNLTKELKNIPEKYDQTDDEFLLTYISGERETNYVIRKEDLALLSFELENKETSDIYSAKYLKFKRYEDVSIPRMIIVENKNENQKINIEYRKMKINEPLFPLALDLPDDAKVIEW
ncbi:MAG: DUF4292 domain-containing protein [Chlorobi bacterium]|nr:DUF4292 domain-containing protein [Chlorobiota bacterium]